jgi:hypothetical protein
MALRISFYLLIFVNLAFYAWSQGHFGAIDDNREPQRLTQQLQAEKLRLAPPAPVPTAAGEALACRLVSGLTMTEAETLKAAMTAAKLDAQVEPLAEPRLYLVVIAELANKAAAEKKAAELTRLGVTNQETVALEDGRHEIVLGRFPDEAGARELLAGFTKKGLKTARVDSRDQPPLKAGVEARGPAAGLLPQLPVLIAPYAGATVGKCES